MSILRTELGVCVLAALLLGGCQEDKGDKSGQEKPNPRAVATDDTGRNDKAGPSGDATVGAGRNDKAGPSGDATVGAGRNDKAGPSGVATDSTGRNDKPSRSGVGTFGGLLPWRGRSKEVKRIIILTNGASPFWDAVRAGMESAASEFKLADAGLQAEVDVNDGTPQNQLERLRMYDTTGDVAALAISVTDGANLAIHSALRDLQKQGVKIITVDSDLDRNIARDVRYAFLGTDNEIAGQELGKAAKAILPEGGKYATFVGLTGATSAKARSQGFQTGAGEDFVLAENLEDRLDLSKAHNNVRDALERNADLKMLVGIWPYNGPAIAEVLDGPGVTFREDGGKVVVFDADPKALSHLEKGTIDAMLVQNPFEMGRSSVRLMKALVEDDEATLKEMFPKYGEENGDLFNTGLKIVAPDQGSPLTKELFGAGAEYVTYSDFKKWLTKYNLTGY